MSGQKETRQGGPDGGTNAHEADSSRGKQAPSRPVEEQYEEGRTEDNVAGQGAGQLTDADRERLRGK